VIQTETCGSCGARMSEDIEWCPRCYTPRPAPAPEEFPARLRMFYADEGPDPEPVYSRWHGGTTTFGPVGRVSITVILLLFQAFWWVVVSAAGVLFVLGSYVISTGLSIWILIHVWKRDRIR
jgi:hypothetical protein